MNQIIGRFVPIGNLNYGAMPFNVLTKVESGYMPPAWEGIRDNGEKYHVIEKAWRFESVEWNGDGLPPVGCVCEIAASTPYLTIKHPEATVVKIYAHFTDDRGVELAAFVDADGKVGGVCTAKCFRPTRSESDKKRDEAIDGMLSIYFSFPPVVDTPNEVDRIAMIALYDAISAGEIPGIRIE